MSSENPYEAPTMDAVATQNTANREHLIRVARAQRLVMLAILAYLGLIPLNLVSLRVPAIGLIVIPAAVCVLVFGAITVYRLAALFRGNAVAVVYVLGLLVPLLGLLLLLSVSQKATALLKANGIKVGLLGANPDRI